MGNYNFSVTLKNGDKVKIEEVSTESSNGTVSDETFKKLLPKKLREWEIIDIQNAI